MIFAVNNHPQAIIDGLKTETRRRITALDRYHEGQTYAIQPKRTAKGIKDGRILMVKKWVELKSKDYPISIESAYAEGCYTPEEYEQLYEKINPKWMARAAFKFEFIQTKCEDHCDNFPDYCVCCTRAKEADYRINDYFEESDVEYCEKEGKK